MTLDPTKLADWQIAEAAEANMKPVGQLAEELGLVGDELIPLGRRLAKIDQLKVLHERTKVPVAVYIREGIDLVLKKHQNEMPGQLTLDALPPKS